MNFVLPIRPSKSARAPKTPKASKTTNALQPPPVSPRRRPSLATRAGVVKRRTSVVATFNAPSISFFEAMFGDDFPDAFASGDGRSCKSRKTFLDLPAEILEIICRPLSKMDIKRLRLTSRGLAETVELRIDRVYVSPNRANLDCLNNILNHPRYHLRVQEVVWDDAQLDEYPTLQQFCEALNWDDRNARVVLQDHLKTLIRTGDDDDTEYGQISVEDCVREDGIPSDIGKAMLLNAGDRKSRDIIAGYAATMCVEDSYVLYQKLFQDEEEIKKRGWDISGLQQALRGFPNLKRITLTSEVWRPWNPIPTYDTPFFRALPADFRKPSLWPWTDRHNCPQPLARLRWRGHWDLQATEQRLPKEWRGYSIIMTSLAAYPVPHLQEFVIDVGHEEIGLPHELFNEPRIDYKNTLRVVSTTPLKKLQLSVMSYGNTSHRMDLLKHVLSAAPHLEHLDLRIGLVEGFEHERFVLDDITLGRDCPKLKHIALRHVWVKIGWLLNLITQAQNLETVVFDMIRMIDPDGIQPYKAVRIFFTHLRNFLVAASHKGPSFTWIQQISDPQALLGSASSHLFQVLDDELSAFLYDGGEMPFNTTDEQVFEPYKPGLGWIMDGRDPTFRKSRNEIEDGFR